MLWSVCQSLLKFQDEYTFTFLFAPRRGNAKQKTKLRCKNYWSKFESNSPKTKFDKKELPVLQFKFNSHWYSWNKLVQITWATSPIYIYIYVIHMLIHLQEEKNIHFQDNSQWYSWNKSNKITWGTSLIYICIDNMHTFSKKEQTYISIDIHRTN